MTALGKDRITPERPGVDYSYPVAAGAKIYAGALVVLNATGFATKGSTAVGLKTVGIAQEFMDNTAGADGAVNVKVRAGVFKLINDGSLVAADVGRTVHIVDDQTVAKTDTNGTMSPAGKLVAFEADGVWVLIDYRRNLTLMFNVDFANMATLTGNDQVVAFPGAEAGDSVSIGLPAAPTAGINVQGFVNAANSVTLRALNCTAGAVDPAAANYRVTLIKG